MKNTGIAVTVLLLMYMLLMPFSQAVAATDGVYTLSEVSAVWDGTYANRYKAPIPAPGGSSYQYEYDHTYGDESTVTYNLPWPFTFYGQAYTQITADTNGNIWFTSAGSAHSFSLANTGRGPVIAAWHNDLSSYYYGGVFVQHKTDSNSDRVVIEWQTESYTEAGYYRPNNFEVVLYKNGNIKIDYLGFAAVAAKDLGSGISKNDGTHFLSLTTLYGNGNVSAPAGRSFAFGDLTPPSLTTNTVPPVAIASSQTLSGTMEAGARIAVTSSSGAVIGTVTYPTPTTWECVVTGLASGNNTFTITATDIAGLSSVATVSVTYAPTLTASLSTSSIAADQKVDVALTITNLTTAGNEVLVEQFVDANRNGYIDAADYVIRAFKVADGASASNPNIQTDNDGTANRAISTSINYQRLNDLYHAPGEYLIRVTKGADSSTVSFKVTHVSQVQTVSGTVSDGANPVPGAMLQLSDKWQRPVSYVIADASGHYVLNVKQPGDYLLLPMAYGYVAPATPVTLAASQNIVNQTLTLTNGTYHAAGIIKDATSSAGIAGVWVQASGSNNSGVAITNSSGAYDLILSAGQYNLSVLTGTTGPGLYGKGYAGFDKQPVSVTVSGTTTVPDISLSVGSILVSGHVLDTFGNAVVGLPVEGKIRGAIDTREPVSFGVSDASGAYSLGLFSATNWDISLDNSVAQTLGYLGTLRSSLSTTIGPLAGNDLTVHPITAWVQGTVKDSSNQPIPGVEVGIRNSDSTVTASALTTIDGTFRIGAYAGGWIIDALTENNASQPVSEQAFTLVDGQTATVNLFAACSSGYTYNATRGHCEKLPECASGTIYNTTSNLCEVYPSCSSGAYNATTNQCESGGSYAGTLNYSCPNGGTLSGTACNVTGSYAATLTGGKTFNVPVYYGRVYDGETGNCFVYTDRITTVPVQCGTLSPVGYIAPSSGAGLAPVYYGNVVDWEFGGCWIYNDRINTGPVQCGTPALIGYVATSSAAGLVPLYHGNFLDTEFGGCTIYNDRITTGPVQCGTTTPVGYIASSPGTYGGTYTCPSGGTLSGTTCITGSSYAATQYYTCPSGGTPNGSTCNTLAIVPSTCIAGTLSETSDKCSVIPVCTAGTLNSTFDVCWAN